MRRITDVLGVLSIAVGGILFLLIYMGYIEPEYGYIKDSNPYVFWLIFLLGLMFFYSVGQFIVLGFVSLTLVLAGKLTMDDAIKYTFFYRMPNKWQDKNAV